MLDTVAHVRRLEVRETPDKIVGGARRRPPRGGIVVFE
jgi:hypothetical protein